MFFSQKYKVLFSIALFNISVFSYHFTKCDDDDFGDIFFSDVLDDLSDDAMPNVTRSVTNLDALTFFTSVVKINNLVANNFYFRTNPINNRSLISLPNYIIYHSDQLNKDYFFNTYLLYNDTYKQYFTKHSSNIGSYLDLNTQSWLERVDYQLGDLNIPQILELFQTGKIQERRIGLLFQYFKNHDRWSFDFTIPLTYQESNYYFSDSEQSVIRQEISKITGTTSASADQSYFEKYAVSDRVGFGDLKFKAGYRIISDELLKFKAGFSLVIPTSFSFKKGMLGSDFRDPLLPPPTINLTNIYNLINEITGGSAEAAEELKNISIDFAQQAGNRLGAIVLDQSLGNWHHPQIGVFCDGKLIYNQNVSLLFSGELLYSLPKKELRFFNQIKDQSDFTNAALLDPVNALPPGPEQEAEAAVQMNFLDQNAVSAFFPTATRSLVSPNFEMQFNIGPRFEVGAYLLHLGYNFWHISKDHISKVEPIEETLYPLNIPDGIAPAATQQKLFLRLNYNMITPKHTWTLAGCLDQTMGSSGIGKDFNVALELSVDF